MPGDFADDIRSAMAEVEERGAPEGQNADEGSRELTVAEPKQPTADRDTSGRFAPKVPAQKDDGLGNGETVNEEFSESNQQPPQPKPPAAQEPAAPALKAPVSWTPEARELWSKLDPVAQKEVYRREREITDTLRATADARNFYAEANRVIAPYMPLIQAERSTPLQAVDNLLRTAAALRTGTVQSKAALVADMITQYNIDVEALDNAIVAKRGGQAAPSNAGPDLSALIDQRLQPLMERLNPLLDTTQRVEQETTQRLQSETEEFMNDSKNEFAWDLKDDMADILDMASRRGIKISLQDAYQRAILLHPTISGIVQTRRGAQGAAQETEAAKRARLAAASLSNDGAPGREGEDGNEADSVRSAIAASIRQAGGRR